MPLKGTHVSNDSKNKDIFLGHSVIVGQVNLSSSQLDCDQVIGLSLSHLSSTTDLTPDISVRTMSRDITWWHCWHVICHLNHVSLTFLLTCCIHYQLISLQILVTWNVILRFCWENLRTTAFSLNVIYFQIVSIIWNICRQDMINIQLK